MRKGLLILCAWILLWLPACQKTYTHNIYELEIDPILVHNDSVGNDWKITYTSNGRAIADGERFTLPIDTTEELAVKVTVTEKDKYPDNGEATAVITLQKDATAYAQITIKENKGRFRGNIAEWQFHFRVKSVKQV